RLDGYGFTPIEWPGEYVYFAIGAQFTVDGTRFPWGFERGEGEGWQPARIAAPAVSTAKPEYTPVRLLTPAQLPATFERPVEHMRVRFVGSASSAAIHAVDNRSDEQERWQALVAGGAPLTIPAATAQRVLIDLGAYTCAYPELLVSGGAGGELQLRWAESLYQEPLGHAKGRRDAVEGRFFRGIGDTWLTDGGPQRRFDTLWWRCGRFLELTVRTQAEPLTVERFTLHETGYPLQPEMRLAASDDRLAEVARIAARSLQMCAHETYMDCPYWEQLMYVGDTRLQALVTYVLTRDDRLPRAALRHFDDSRLPSGLTQSRYPSRVTQVITPFALWWVAMLHDYALWRDDAALLRELLPGARAVIDGFGRFLNADGLVQAPAGWNFMDWASQWHAGVPPDGELGVSASINWLYVYALERSAQLEAWHGEPELAARARRIAAGLATRLDEALWDERRGLFADDLAHRHFSEHTQCLALLSGHLPAERRPAIEHGLLTDSALTRTTIYFTHYLFEAYAQLGRIDALFERLSLWFDLPAQGFTTTPEMPEPSRSDCHAWGAHPLYHMFASLLGIRPATPGFRSVTIAPQLGPLTWLRGELPHPGGTLAVDLAVEGQRLTGTIALPGGVTGVLTWQGAHQQLDDGVQAIALDGTNTA
ncbi:MAG TPA: alpha-L-rhamnosidase C-terminal domain-containing protein, partial [Roseiflexaceae bacterium]|nr:alpha-L-rhamnosidase C-terminal domain-containing protein [Roseiflexaceae bacterium]